MDTHFLGFHHLVPNGTVPERDMGAEFKQLQQQLADVRKEKDAEIQQLQQQLGDVKRDKDAEIQQLQQQLGDGRRDEDAETQQLQQQLGDGRRDEDALSHQLEQQLGDGRRDEDALSHQLEQLIDDLHFHEVQIQHFQQCLSQLRRENERLQEVSDTLSQKLCRYILSIEMHLHKLLYCTFLTSFPGPAQLSVAGSMEKRDRAWNNLLHE